VEIDKRRDKARPSGGERRPRGAAAEARARSATQSYLKQLDARLFAKSAKAGAPSNALADAVRAALGTPGLDEACRRYLAEAGPPREPSLVAAFLDARDRELPLAALDALAEEIAAGRATLTPGVRAQLRLLAAGADDEIAERAEGLLGPGQAL
jgi:hypothetical protein